MLNSERLILEARRSMKPLILLVLMAGLAAVTFAGIARNITFQRPWQSYRTVRVQFDDVKGIFPGGHQVRIHGVKVGIVSKSKLVNGHPVLTLKIEKKWGPIYKDAHLRIRPVTPLEDLYVNVTDRGHASAGEAKQGDIIAADQTVSPVDVSRVLDTFNAPTRERMTILLSELGKGLNDGGAKLRATFASLAPFLHVAEDTTRVLAERQAALKRVIHNFGSLSEALAKRDQDLNKFVVQGNQTLGELAQNDQPLAATLSSLGQLVPVMRDSFAAVENLSGHLDPALTSLKPVAADLKSGLASLQKFGTDATPALAAFRPATRDLRTMARTLPATSSSLSAAFSRLRGQAPQFDSLTQKLDPCMATLNNFMNNTMSVLKYTDANGSFPRADEIVDTDALSDVNSPPVNTKPIATCTGGK
jgi:virulence factor Mce-like protein